MKTPPSIEIGWIASDPSHRTGAKPSGVSPEPCYEGREPQAGVENGWGGSQRCQRAEGQGVAQSRSKGADTADGNDFPRSRLFPGPERGGIEGGNPKKRYSRRGGGAEGHTGAGGAGLMGLMGFPTTATRARDGGVATCGNAATPWDPGGDRNNGNCRAVVLGVSIK